MVYKVPPSEEKTTETGAPTVVKSGESKGSGAIADGNNHSTEQLREIVKELLSSSRTFEASRKMFCDTEAQVMSFVHIMVISELMHPADSLLSFHSTNISLLMLFYLFQASTAYWESLKALVKRNIFNIEKCVIYLQSRLEAERSYAESLYNIQEKVEGKTIDNVQPSAKAIKQRQGTQRGDHWDRKDQCRGKATGITVGPGKNATALEHMFWHDTNTANLILDMCNDGKEFCCCSSL